jgi:hypothetical protein
MIAAFINLGFIFAILTFLILFINLLLKKNKDKKINPLIIVLISIFLIIYIRGIVFYNDPLPFGDEKAYAKIIEIYQKDSSHPISGPGYIDIITSISRLTSLTFQEASLYLSILISAAGLLIIYFMYKKQTKDELFSALSIILLITTSYFIYPLIEARPQQLGIILVFFGSLLFNNCIQSRNAKSKILFSIVFLFTFYYHILSFVILSAIVFFLFFWEKLNKKAAFKDIIIPSILFIICSFLYFLPGSPYERNKQDIINTSIGLWSNITLKNSAIIALATLSLIIIIFLFLKYLSGFEKEKVKKIKFFLLSFVISILALAIQFYLNYKEYLYFYKGSIAYFLFFQVSNIIFGVFYLLGVKDILDNSKKQDIFFKGSIILLIIGIIIILPSVFLDSRLNNILIRILNYLTLFAAPIAAISLRKLIKNKTLAIVLLPIMIIISLINASRNPLFFNYNG